MQNVQKRKICILEGFRLILEFFFYSDLIFISNFFSVTAKKLFLLYDVT